MWLPFVVEALMEIELLPGDIVSVVVEESYCGLPIGIHQGIIVDLATEGRSIAFTDPELALRAKGMKMSQFIRQNDWGYFDIGRICRGINH